MHRWSRVGPSRTLCEDRIRCFWHSTTKRFGYLSDGPFSLFLVENPINQAQDHKYLGVLIDTNLNSKQHVHKLLVKVSKRIGVLGRIRNNLTADSVLPLVDYCNVAWSSIGKIERDDRLDRA